MTILHALAGSCFSLSWFLFADGLAKANEITDASKHFTFVMWLPGLLCMIMIALMALVDISALQGASDDSNMMMGGYTDESTNQKARVLFFVAATFGLAGMSVAIWKMADTYNSSDDSWPGVALLLQVIVMMATCAFLVGARTKKTSDDGF